MTRSGRSRLDPDIAEAFAQDRRRVAMADTSRGAETRVIGIGVGNDCALNRALRIDVKVARGAKEPAIG
jgi:hypothetical protein